MKSLLTFAAAGAAALMLSFPASATMISFADYAAGNEHGITSGTSVNISGVNMTFSSNYYPYFDDISGGQPAGLGVCRDLSVTLQCVDASDDSIDGDFKVGEWVNIAFDDGPFDILDIGFRDGEHNSLNSDDVGLLYVAVNFAGGGSDSGLTTFANMVALAASGYFANVENITFAYKDTEYYVEYISDVPLPGAIPLLLSGIAGLGFASRRKKAA